MEYKWKFKLPSGFQSSSSFTHLHQLKAVGGTQSSMPLITLTARKASPNDKLQLRYAEATSQTTIYENDLTPFFNEWVEVTELVTYGELGTGTYSVEIKKVSDNSILFTYSNSNIRMWKTDADFIRPKWGVYRSLNVPSDLRDEEVLFADFSIEENPSLSVDFNELDTAIILSNPVGNKLEIRNPNRDINAIIVHDINGKQLFDYPTENQLNINIDVSKLTSGVYIIHLISEDYKAIKKIIKL